MRLRKILKRAGIAAATFGLGAGLAVQAMGCGGTGRETEVTEGAAASVSPALPSLDLNVPAEFQTATFAFG